MASMTAYIQMVKRALRDQHGFKPDRGSEQDPVFNSIPEGEYLCVIEGRSDLVKIIGTGIDCCNFQDDNLIIT